MKSLTTLLAVGNLLAALAMAQPTGHTFTDLGMVGAQPGQPFFVTNNTLASGAATAADGTSHAVLWYRGLKIDISKPGLGGGNTVAFGNNEEGRAVGQADTSKTDPNGEDFCGFHSMGVTSHGAKCEPFVWEYGMMTALPTLGGNNGVANSINTRGDVAGLAENATKDPACPAPQVFQFKPAVWEQGKIRELPTFPGDAEGAAFAINKDGQVVGASGTCAAFNPNTLVNLQPLHALLWETGRTVDLGTLGGTGKGFGNIAFSLNNAGQVVGASDLRGDQTYHGFLWTMERGMRDLGTLPGDASSAALSVNDNGDVVGLSQDADFNPRAFLLQNGVMTDLNALLPANSHWLLMLGCSINSHGDIVGLAMDKVTGEFHAFLATPGSQANAGNGLSNAGASSQIALSDEDRELLRLRLRFIRFGAPAAGRK